MIDRNRPRAESPPEVVVIQPGLMAYLRRGIVRMISEVALEISVITDQGSELDVQAFLAKTRRLDTLRVLLNKAGITAHGTRPAPQSLTEADHPELALKALETEYRMQLSRVEDAETTGFNATTRYMAELGELVSALRERLGLAGGADETA